MVTTAIGSAGDFGRAMAVQSDGKIVVAGNSWNGSNHDFALARYTANGLLDTGFGTGGKVTTGIGVGDFGRAVAVQSDGKIVVAGDSNNDFAAVRYTASGSAGHRLWDTDGVVTTAIGAGQDKAHALALQSGGEIVVAGYSNNGVHDDFAVARYTSAGVLDTSFGRDADNDGDRDGYVTTGIGTVQDRPYAVLVQPDGKIVAAGMIHDGVGSNRTVWDFAVARYNADGTLDIGFGTDGKVTTDFQSGGDDRGEAAALQSDGKIVVAGRSNKGNDKRFAVARYTADGALDTTFGTGGKVTTSFSSNEDRAYAVAVQSDGKIVVAGYANNGNDNDFAIARYNADGALDAGFGTGGKVTTALGSGNDRIRAMALQSDGKIVVAGGIGGDFAVARYNADGSPDTGFGTNGRVTTTMSSSDDTALAVAVQGDGKIVAAGGAVIGGDYDFALARYTSAGVLDTSFGTVSGSSRTGWVTTPIGSQRDIAYEVLLQRGGRIVAAGWSGSPTPGDHPKDFALARYTEDGSLDTGFGTGGKVTTSFVAGDDRAWAAALQPDGKIVLAGYAWTGEVYEFALARYHAPVAHTPPTVTLSASPNPVTPVHDPDDPDLRKANTVTIKAALSWALPEVVWIPVTLDQDASNPDHGVISTIGISANELTGTHVIGVFEDVDTVDDTFTVSLDTANLPSTVVAGNPSSVTVTIQDTDPKAAPGALSNFRVTPKVRHLLATWNKPTSRTDHSLRHPVQDNGRSQPGGHHSQ